MVMNSINTNVGAMVALSNLNTINKNLAQTQNRVSTGLNVSSAKDDASIFAVAQGIRADIKSFDAVGQALSSAKGAATVAIAGATESSNLMQDIKAKLVQLSDDTLTSEQRSIYTDDLKQMVDQVKTFIDRSVYNGQNIIGAVDTNGTPTPFDPTDDTAPISMNVVQSTDGSTLTLRANNLTGGSITTGWQGFARIVYATADDTSSASGISYTANVPTARSAVTSSQARAALGNVDTTDTSTAVFADAWDNFNNTINTALSNLGADSRNIDFQMSFNKSLQDAATEGLGSLVDADLAKESAKLTAYQTKQQLATQTLSIANQAPSALLGLFR